MSAWRWPRPDRRVACPERSRGADPLPVPLPSTRGRALRLLRGRGGAVSSMRPALLHQAALALALLALSGADAWAGGFEVADQGPRAAGRAGAFTARADDLSAIDFNPAGLARLKGTRVFVANRFTYALEEYRRARTLDWSDAIHGVPDRVDFPHVTNGSPTQLLGTMIAVSSDFGLEDWTFAAGVYGPPGTTSQSFPLDGPQKYMLVGREVVSLYYTLSAAWKWRDTFALGASLQIGYFAQAHEDLGQDNSVLEELMLTTPSMLPAEGRDILAQFLFQGDDIHKLVRELSGGERGRLALAKLIQEGANFLLLDEPTNHLDLPSQEVLQDALSEFPGTILLVSHDRYLVDALATQVWVAGETEGRLEVYLDGYQEYLEARSRQETAGRNKKEKTRSAPAARSQGRQKQALRELEETIESLETELAFLSSQLELHSTDVELVRKHGERYAEVQRQLEASMHSWEALANEVAEA